MKEKKRRLNDKKQEVKQENAVHRQAVSEEIKRQFGTKEEADKDLEQTGARPSGNTEESRKRRRDSIVEKEQDMLIMSEQRKLLKEENEKKRLDLEMAKVLADREKV